MKEIQINSAVFYAKKHLSNAITLEYAVLLVPVKNEQRTAYSIAAEGFGESVRLDAVTCDKTEADHFFNALVCENVKPSELNAFLNRITL